MNRSDLLRAGAAGGFLSAGGIVPSAARAASASPAAPLTPPATGSIPVAFLISEGAVVIDFCGPWEVFQDAGVPSRTDAAFTLYTVAETTKPIRASGGLRIVPDYDYSSAPAPRVVVIPAQSVPNDATKEWIRATNRNADVTMSVCTGAFVLASTGLLSGKAATTHHTAYAGFAMQFPDVDLRRGVRFVEDGNLATAGGLTSGIDLAMHVVERYYGRTIATGTAYQMEYQGRGWLDPASNAEYAHRPAPTPGLAQCAVCWMDVDPHTALSTIYRGASYYFCMPSCKEQFAAAPGRFAHA